MNNSVKYMDIADFRKEGYLQEVNRQFFHPLGLALEVTRDEDGSERLSGVWESRQDPEGIYYAEDPDLDKAANVSRRWFEVGRQRAESLGYVIQPVASHEAGSYDSADLGDPLSRPARLAAAKREVRG